MPSFDTSDQVRAFEWYRQRSVKMLSGELGTGFWGNVIIKASVSEPAVRHALLAVSALHETVEARDGRDVYPSRRLAYSEYGKAIACLRSWSSRSYQSSALPLLVCVLFVCFEFLADRQTASQMHICQGRSILSQMQTEERSPARDMIKQALVPIYVRLSLASFTYGSRPEPVPLHLKTWMTVPTAFSSFEEAHYLLYSLLDQCLQFSTRATQVVFDPSTATDEIQHLQNLQHRFIGELAQWHSAFTVFSSIDAQAQTEAVVGAKNLLLLYWHTSRIWVSVALQAQETKYDTHLADFASIISLATSILDATSRTERNVFSFESEIIGPVYWIVTKCRHPLLRRAALRVLARDEMQGCRENHWHVEDTIAIAIRVIEVEEAGFSFSKPLDGGVSHIDPLSGLINSLKPDGGRPGVVRLRNLDPSELVWATRPPLIPGEEPIAGVPGSEAASEDYQDENFLLAPARSSRSSSASSLSGDMPARYRIPQSGHSGLEPPFDVPEWRRVKNILIGPREHRGVWATFFESPREGEQTWKISREFIRI